MPPRNNPPNRRYCFTLNNWTDAEYANLASLLSQENVVSYGVVGKEIGEQGTPHLQGFVIFKSPQRLDAVRSLIPRAHLEVARATSEQASGYCKKDGDFVEFGTFPSRQGARSDLAAGVAWLDEFERANGRPAASPDVARELPELYIRFPRFTRLAQQRAAPIDRVNGRRRRSHHYVLH